MSTSITTGRSAVCLSSAGCSLVLHWKPFQQLVQCSFYSLVHFALTIPFPVFLPTYSACISPLLHLFVLFLEPFLMYPWSCSSLPSGNSQILSNDSKSISTTAHSFMCTLYYPLVWPACVACFSFFFSTLLTLLYWCLSLYHPPMCCLKPHSPLCMSLMSLMRLFYES